MNKREQARLLEDLEKLKQDTTYTVTYEKLSFNRGVNAAIELVKSIEVGEGN